MACIELENITKRYFVYRSRRHLLWRYLSRDRTSRHVAEQQALSNINLRIMQGQSIGLIGRNGSGKSTLLQLIAGIVHPTHGKRTVNGRISSVLDLQSGLHEKLTGYENIFLKGAIQGLRKQSIIDRMDEIVEFSGLQDYINYPVNTYSTGMVVRLGFSIAMHMDFDILLLDEVLAVGDIVFQRQCLARIRQFLKEGKTIVLASHGLSDVAAICKRVVLMKNGSIQHDGPTESILKSYWEACRIEQNRIPRHLHPFSAENVYGMDTNDIRIVDVRFMNRQRKERDSFLTGDYMAISITVESDCLVSNPVFRVQFFRNDGLLVHGTNTARVGLDTGNFHGHGEVIIEYERLNFLEGDYFVSVGIWPDEYCSALMDISYDCHSWGYVIHVESRRNDGGGFVYVPFRWRILKNADEKQGEYRN